MSVKETQENNLPTFIAKIGFLLKNIYFLSKKPRIIPLIILLTTPINLANADNPVRIITCNKYLELIIQEITDKKAAISSTFNNNQPSINLPIALNKQTIDILACDGTLAESLWLNKMLNDSDNKNYQIFYAKNSIEIINNNPNFYYNPKNVQIIAQNFTRLIIATDPKNAKFYQRNFNRFNKDWQENLEKWQKKLETLQKTSQIISNSNKLLYFFNWAKIPNIKQQDSSKYDKLIIKSPDNSRQINLHRVTDIDKINKIEDLFRNLIGKIT